MMASEAGLIFSERSKLRYGDLRWLAPELFLEEVPIRTKPDDVYALGMTILEIFTGEVPYSKCGHDFLILKTVERGTLPTCTGISEYYFSDPCLRNVAAPLRMGSSPGLIYERTYDCQGYPSYSLAEMP
ncbi:hypothetical protein RSAG8_07557, partial [Rhizoctonia solani AG-8 WAC10335]